MQPKEHIYHSQSRNRLDKELFKKGLANSRSHAGNLIKLGLIKVNNQIVTKPGMVVQSGDKVEIISEQKYVSRAGLKLASVAEGFMLDFKGKIILDIGSSTGGFTDYALQNGAKKVVAVDVGTDQLHPNLRNDKRIELHEKTDIRDFLKKPLTVDIILADVSFISLREILPSLKAINHKNMQIVAMCKPQFEAGKDQINKGVVKNNNLRRQILKEFETWLKDHEFIIINKADSAVAGGKGNLERFYLLRLTN